MTSDEALAFLHAHSPLPDDASISQDELDGLDDVRRHLLDNPDPRAIRPLLMVFGDGSGFGVYQLIEGVIAKFSVDMVVPPLFEALASPNRGVRYWSTQIASRFPDARLIPALTKNLNDLDSDIRYMAVVALNWWRCRSRNR